MNTINRVLDTSSGSDGSPDEMPPEAVAVDDEDQLVGLLDATIMMVDDESTTIDVIQTFLEDAGFRNFISTSEPVGALDMIRERRPDVLLLDLMMPEVNGFDILKQMMADEVLRYIPTIILTSSTDAETKLQALELGATDFLGKPVDPSELALRVRNTLAAKAYRDRLAYYDTLTGLPNRRMFMDRLAGALRSSDCSDSYGAVLNISLDRFKEIGDTIGITAGDALLKSVAERLVKSMRASDYIGRLGDSAQRNSLYRIGGDEFTLLLCGIKDADGAAKAGRRVLKLLAEPFHTDSGEFFVTASIGIAITPDDGDNIDTLLTHVNVATNLAKQEGGNNYQFYSKAINTRSLERLNLENQLRRVLERGELELYYQPKLNVQTGQLIGAEALLRWNHPQLGLVPPVKFIPLAEETGLIVPIGEWVLQEACRQTKAWQDAGLGRLRIAVNVASQQLRHGDILPVLEQALVQSGLAAEYLTVELTESCVMEGARAVVDLLHRMKALGLKLSIDDFGTGYSSLSYLKRFPLDELKIDRSFVTEAHTNANDGAIVAAIVVMAKTLGLHVVAEGVETAEQLELLSATACDEFQGYLFSKPVPADQFFALASKAAKTPAQAG